MYDPLNDAPSGFLYQKVGSSLDEEFVSELKKEAKTYGGPAFADPKSKMFPIFNEKAAAASYMYAQHQEVPAPVMERIKEAMELFNIEVEVPQEKVAAAPDPDDYLFPDQQKVLVQTREQLKSAELLVRQKHDEMPLITRTFAYRRLQEKAAALDVELEPESIRYTARARCDVARLCGSIQARRGFVKEANLQAAYKEVERSLRESGLRSIDDEEQKQKIAHTLHELDELAGITHRYNRSEGLGFEDPVLAVYNTDKTASDFVQMAGREVPLEQLMALDPDMIGDVVGEEFMEDIVDDSGQIDPMELQQTLSILPTDMQEEIAKRFNL